LSSDVRSVASLFISRWDKATTDKLPGNLRDRLGIAVAETTYGAYRDLLDSERWQRLENWGARTQRLLFASTGTKDPRAPDTLYIGALAAPNTINTIPEETLSHFAVIAKSGASYLGTVGAQARRFRRSSRRASIAKRWRQTFNSTAPNRSTSPGATCSRRLRQKRRR
jgi:transaldolase